MHAYVCLHTAYKKISFAAKEALSVDSAVRYCFGAKSSLQQIQSIIFQYNYILSVSRLIVRMLSQKKTPIK